jgi:thioredoxin
MINNLKDDNFTKEVLENEGPVLVDFWAPWCMPCKMLGPVIEKIAEKYDGKIKVCKVNVDEAPQTASNYQIMSIPTIGFFSSGKLKDQSVGVPTQEDLESKIEDFLLTTAKK